METFVPINHAELKAMRSVTSAEVESLDRFIVARDPKRRWHDGATLHRDMLRGDLDALDDALGVKPGPCRRRRIK